MRIVHNATGGATVYITDLKMRLGPGNAVPVNIRDVATSVDLVRAVEGDLVRIDFTEEEQHHPDLRYLLLRIEQVEAKRESKVLYAKVEETVKSNKADSPTIPVRPAVFAPVASQNVQES